MEDLKKSFLKAQEKANRAKVTLMAYQAPFALLSDVLGKERALEDIDYETISEVVELITEVPSNAKLKFGNRSLVEIIQEKKRDLSVPRISSRTAADYFMSINTLFNYAVECKMMPDNPLNNRRFKERFNVKKEKRKAKKSLFTIEELQGIFQAPIYTGCEDDEHHYAKIGENKPRRGRFWVPLMGLFHGMRLNELVQLYIEDVMEEDGHPCIFIREERADGSSCEKKFKNDTSKRILPIHPMLLKMGFLDFFKERKASNDSPRLYPELGLGHNGYYSDSFQKWFGRFLKQTLGYKPQATFHSFRHMWRDRLRAASIGIEMAEALGGWSDRRKSSEPGYGQGFAMTQKYDALSKVKYPDLDLSHLYGE